MIPISNRSFQKIICFYLFECPARNYKRKGKDKNGKPIFVFHKVSDMGKTLAERGIEGGSVNTLRAAMLRVAGRDFAFSANKEVIKPDTKEYIAISRLEFKTEGIFCFIRNSLAHGEFEVVNGVYSFRNTKNGIIKGIGRIRESTLLKWIDIVNMVLCQDLVQNKVGYFSQ